VAGPRQETAEFAFVMVLYVMQFSLC